MGHPLLALHREDHPSWFKQHYQMYEMLYQYGLVPNKHKPYDAGFPPTRIGDLVFRCDPIRRIANHKSSKHRLFYYCPDCDAQGKVRWIPFGRASQHSAIHQE